MQSLTSKCKMTLRLIDRILVADPDIAIDRISSPQFLSDGVGSKFLQVEKEVEKVDM